MGSQSASASPIVTAHSSSLISPFRHLYHGSSHHHHPVHALQSPRLRLGPGLHGHQLFVQPRQEHSWAWTRAGDDMKTLPLQQAQPIIQIEVRQDFTSQKPQSQPGPQPQSKSQPQPQLQSQPQPQPRSQSEPLSATTTSQPLTSQPSSPGCSRVSPPHQTRSDTQASSFKSARAKLSTTKLRALFASRRSHSHSSQSSDDSAHQRSSPPSPLATTIEVAPIPEEPPAQPDPPRAPPVAEPKIEPKPTPARQAARPAPGREATDASSTNGSRTNASPSNKRRNSTRGDSSGLQASPSTLKKQRPEVQPPKIVPIQYSLCPVDDLVVLIAHMIEELIQTNDALALSSGSLTRFHSRTAPGISVLEYLRRLARHATLTQPILLSMVYYIDRLCAMYPEFTINTLTVHRFLITAGTVAAKGLLDSYWTNATYARVGGVRLAELKLLELEFLYRVDWRIIPNPEVLVAYYQGLVDRHADYVMEEEVLEDDDEEEMYDDVDDVDDVDDGEAEIEGTGGEEAKAASGD